MKKYLFLLLLFLEIWICSAEYCGYNRYGNYYCSYDDGSYEYRNQQTPWNPYYGLPYYSSKGNYHNSYNEPSYYFYCPQHSHKINYNECECDIGYKVSGNKCIPDQSYHCSTKFPGTAWDDTLQKCICLNGEPMSRDPIHKWCPIWQNLCRVKYGKHSKRENFNTCGCENWFSMKWNLCTEDTSYLSRLIGGVIVLRLIFLWRK